MSKIVIFDSGLGSLSIIKSIRKKICAEVIYFADQRNYPYGTKTVRDLNRIIKSTISKLQEKFDPDIIVIGSNTPSVLLDLEKNDKIIGVFPPLKEAVLKTKTARIGILATKSVVNSQTFYNYTKKFVPAKIKIVKINATNLVDLVESGKFISQKHLSKKIIKKIVTPLLKNNVDIVILSSTHLPFLLPVLRKFLPDVTFLDPADSVTEKILKIIKHKTTNKNRFKIFTSGNAKAFHQQLLKIGIKNKVTTL